MAPGSQCEALGALAARGRACNCCCSLTTGQAALDGRYPACASFEDGSSEVGDRGKLRNSNRAAMALVDGPKRFRPVWAEVQTGLRVAR